VVIKAILVETVTVAAFTIHLISYFFRMQGLFAEFANIRVCTAFMTVFIVETFITFVVIIAAS